MNTSSWPPFTLRIHRVSVFFSFLTTEREWRGQSQGPCQWDNGEHLVDGKGGPEGKLSQFIEQVLGGL